MPEISAHKGLCDGGEALPPHSVQWWRAAGRMQPIRASRAAELVGDIQSECAVTGHTRRRRLGDARNRRRPICSGFCGLRQALVDLPPKRTPLGGKARPQALRPRGRSWQLARDLGGRSRSGKVPSPRRLQHKVHRFEGLAHGGSNDFLLFGRNRNGTPTVWRQRIDAARPPNARCDQPRSGRHGPPQGSGSR